MKEKFKMSDPYIRECPNCQSNIEYSTKSHLQRAIKRDGWCLECNGKLSGAVYGKRLRTEKQKEFLRKLRLGKLLTDETKNKISKSLMSTHPKGMLGKHHSLETLKKIQQKRLKSKFWQGKRFSKEHKQKISDAAIENYKSLQRDGFRPNYNKIACQIFDEINREFGWKGLHAENGGEVNLGRYWVDYYDVRLNLIIEFDEKVHREPKQHKNDKTRQEKLQEFTHGLFIRLHEEWDLQTILNYIREVLYGRYTEIS